MCAMLATIIRTSITEEVSIRIMDAFVAMRKYISSGSIEQKYINKLVLDDHDKILSLEKSFNKFEEKRIVNEIYFKGQIYDAYSKIKDIFSKAKKKLIIIDGYADKTLLNMIKDLTFNVILITKKYNKLKDLDIEKYNSQYHNLRVIYDDTFHDRYFILDKEIIYHSGTSINNAGSKTFSINVLEDKLVKEFLIKNVKDIIKY